MQELMSISVEKFALIGSSTHDLQMFYLLNCQDDLNSNYHLAIYHQTVDFLKRILFQCFDWNDRISFQIFIVGLTGVYKMLFKADLTNIFMEPSIFQNGDLL